jgi:ADP-heptose:LPS heptosyltransferase
MSQTKILKFIDAVIGSVLLVFLPSSKERPDVDLKTVKRILLIRPGGLGDMVLLSPMAAALCSKFGKPVDVLCEKRNAGAAQMIGLFDRIYLYDRPFELIQCLRQKYDVVIDTEQWHRLSAIIGRISRAPIRIGFDTNDRRKVFTHPVAYSHDDYEVQSFFNLLRPLSGESVVLGPNGPFMTARHEIPKDIKELPEEDRKRLICVAPGASVPERRWGMDKFADVANHFAHKNYRIVLLGSAAEKNVLCRLAKEIKGAVDLSGKTPLPETAAVLKASRLLLTPDSGLLHVARAVGTPTVSLFGAGIEKKWAPRGKRHVVLNKHLPCSPCTKFGYTPKCPIGVQCLVQIGEREVIEAMESLLERE